MKTQHLLKNELHRVSMIENAIDTDERHLRDAMDHHKSLDTKQAQRQLSALQNAQRQERRVLAASIAFFGLAVLYILWSRVLYRLDFVSVLLDRMV
jgi:1,4-dihydroxy-2-naphthoate octaprenyltransferase